MVRMLHYNTHIETFCNLNATWDRLVFLKRKHVRFSQIILILIKYLIG